MPKGSETDTLNFILSSSELQGGMFARCEFRGTWQMAMCSEDAHMLFHIVRQGEIVCRYSCKTDPSQSKKSETDFSRSVTLQAGDVLLLPFGDRHCLQQGEPIPSSLLTLTKADLEAFKVVQPSPQSTRSDQSVDASVLCGYYRLENHSTHPLIKQLPAVAIIRAGTDTQKMEQLVTMIDKESAVLHDGSRAIIDRLAEALLMYMLRAWTRQQEKPSGLLAALADPVVSKALRALHEQPEYQWTVAKLATLGGASRAKFAKRFQTLMGYGPFQYLTEVRIRRAVRLLHDSNMSLAIVAEHIGYGSETAFAKVFKKHTGQTPSQFRKSIDFSEYRS